MTTRSYRIYIALILTTLSGVGVFVLMRESGITIPDLIRETIAASITTESHQPIPPAIPKIQIEIEKIISERYLDTLNRIVVEQLGQSI
jgi:hypothetical protein